MWDMLKKAKKLQNEMVEYFHSANMHEDAGRLEDALVDVTYGKAIGHVLRSLGFNLGELADMELSRFVG